MEKIFEKINFKWSDDSNRLILTPSLFALNNLFYIQEIGEFKTLPGYFAEREGLDSLLLVLTLSGKGELRYDGKTYPALPGTFFWIDCGERHSYRNLSDWSFLWLHFGGASSKGFYRHWSRTHTPAAHAPERMQSDLETLLTLGRIPSPAGELECSRVINRMLTDILLADFPHPLRRTPRRATSRRFCITSTDTSARMSLSRDWRTNSTSTVFISHGNSKNLSESATANI